jgi:hypothetical protein
MSFDVCLKLDGARVAVVKPLGSETVGAPITSSKWRLFFQTSGVLVLPRTVAPITIPDAIKTKFLMMY